MKAWALCFLVCYAGGCGVLTELKGKPVDVTTAGIPVSVLASEDISLFWKDRMAELHPFAGSARTQVVSLLNTMTFQETSNTTKRLVLAGIIGEEGAEPCVMIQFFAGGYMSCGNRMFVIGNKRLMEIISILEASQGV